MKFDLRKSSLAVICFILILSKTVTASPQTLEQDAPKSKQATEETEPAEDDSPSTTSDERTAAEFRAYVAEKLPHLTDKQLDSLVAKVDADSDGKISDSEFDNRMTAVQAIQTSEKDDSNEEPKSDSDSDDSADSDSDNSEPKETEPVIIDALTPSTDATVLLITADELAKSWVPFAKWKTAKSPKSSMLTASKKRFDCASESTSTTTKPAG